MLKNSPNLGKLIYMPTLTLTNGNLQAALNFFYTQFHKLIHSEIKPNRQFFELSDGGRVALDFRTRRDNDGAKSDILDNYLPKLPLVVIFPGILSSISDHYIRTLIANFEKSGYDWVLINYIGINAEIA